MTDAAKTRLSQARILDAALDLIEAEGLDALSTRSLGAKLGVRAMALYHYVPSKDALLDLIQERLLQDVVFVDPALTWRAQTEAVARSYVNVARTRPRAFPLLAMRRFNTRGALAFLERMLRLFRDAGLSPEEAAIAFRMLGYFLNGAGLALSATLVAKQRSDFRLADAKFLIDYPASVEVVPFLTLDHLDPIFERGLATLLDRIEVEIRRAGRI